jgi:hypothetical protein
MAFFQRSGVCVSSSRTRPLKAKLFRRQFLGTLRSKMVSLLFGVLIMLSAGSAQRSTAAKPVVRPCADSWSDSGSNAKKNRPKSPKKEPQKEQGACIEGAFSALEIQEYLQSYARAQQWKISDDRVNEDSWTFSLELDKDTLLRDTTEDSRNRRVEWTEGTVRVHVNTTQLPDGYSRTIVRASFRGYGRSADQFAMQKDYWQLDSNNNLENSIVAALQSHFSVTSSAGAPPSQMSLEIPLVASRWSTGDRARGFSDWTQSLALWPTRPPTVLF